jgi:hypothetical protein
VIARAGALPENPELAPLMFENYNAVFGWLMSDEPRMIESAKTAEMMRHYTELRHADGFEELTLPAEHFVLLRGVFLVLGVLGQLQATNRWFDIAGEWIYGNAPATELGEQEAAFFTRHPYPVTTGLAGR